MHVFMYARLWQLVYGLCLRYFIPRLHLSKPRIVHVCMMPLVSGLCAIIPGGISVEDYAIATSTDHVSAKSMLLDLVENQIGVQEKQSFEFNDGDRLRAAILCLQIDVASNLNTLKGWHLRY